MMGQALGVLPGRLFLLHVLTALLTPSGHLDPGEFREVVALHMR